MRVNVTPPLSLRPSLNSQSFSRRNRCCHYRIQRCVAASIRSGGSLADLGTVRGPLPTLPNSHAMFFGETLIEVNCRRCLRGYLRFEAGRRRTPLPLDTHVTRKGKSLYLHRCNKVKFTILHSSSCVLLDRARRN